MSRYGGGFLESTDEDSFGEEELFGSTFALAGTKHHKDRNRVRLGREKSRAFLMQKKKDKSGTSIFVDPDVPDLTSGPEKVAEGKPFGLFGEERHFQAANAQTKGEAFGISQSDEKERQTSSGKHKEMMAFKHKRKQKQIIRKAYAKHEWQKNREREIPVLFLKERLKLSLLGRRGVSPRKRLLPGIFLAVCLYFVLTVSEAAGMGLLLTNAITSGSNGAFFSAAEDIEACENYVTLLECELRESLANIETDYPDYDEYSYALYNIGHNPVELIAYLSMKEAGFTYASIKDELQALTGRMYEMIVEPVTEVRFRLVTKEKQIVKVRPVIKTREIIHFRKEKDSHTGVVQMVPYIEVVEYEDEETYYDTEVVEEEEAYEADILQVTLLVKSISEIVKEDRKAGLLEEAQVSQYETYLATGGGLQIIKSPTKDPWKDKVSSAYGYRIHPISAERQFHKGVDIALPVGTELYSGVIGKVTESTFEEGYGNVVSISSDKGFTVRYAHLSERLVSEGALVTADTLIAKSGNSGRSTGPHLHMEIRIGSEIYNPMFYVIGEGREENK